MESRLVGQGIANESEGFLFKPYYYFGNTKKSNTGQFILQSWLLQNSYLVKNLQRKSCKSQFFKVIRKRKPARMFS